MGMQPGSYYRKRESSANPREAITESAKSIMIKRWLLHILEHGSVPAVALALAIAPTNSRSGRRNDLPQSRERGTEIGLFGAHDRYNDLGNERLRARRSVALTVPTIGRTADHHQTN
jgi:hypothetical protein